MVGYDSITPQAPLVPAAVPPGNPRAPLPARRAQSFRGQRVHRGLQLQFPERGSGARVRVRSGGAHPRAESDRQQSGIDARHRCCRASGGTSRRTPSIARASACSKSAWRSTGRHGGTAGRDSAPGGGALRPAGRRHLRTEARGRVPDAGRARRVPAGGARLRASGARGGDPMEGRGGRAAVRTAPAVRGERARGDPRSGSAAWWNR